MAKQCSCYINVSNSTSAGYVGLGIKSTATATTLPGFNFQVHGTTDYIVTVTNPFPQAPTNLNYGKTARIGLTNSTTGLTSADGGVIRMSHYTLHSILHTKVNTNAFYRFFIPKINFRSNFWSNTNIKAFTDPVIETESK